MCICSFGSVLRALVVLLALCAQQRVSLGINLRMPFKGNKSDASAVVRRKLKDWLPVIIGESTDQQRQKPCDEGVKEDDQMVH